MVGEAGLVKVEEGLSFEKAKNMLISDKLTELHDLQEQCGIAQRAVERCIFLIEKDVK